ncbi:Oidioi.mRNA.OKI2018_I69.PAR.g13063.t1.cds [Oikopleura dioica]|uniref:Oidioi.mRNA.OKI2018_I69.PAR.g13063.t1.cds n=1 Tax=Oikopleura dioica TaxID=34765 RepID=A0ABN7S7K1_OIKDI|nr:Oidioi.mRNA.OKI2018_I69.PAR.g13063.t1.cds [Oikopleura dioica]
MRFLMQMYSPGDSTDSFHRTIYVFICSSKNGCTAAPLVLRQQLPLKNAFYPEEPPSYDDPIEAIKFKNNYPSPNMCVVCGYPGPNRCAKCKKTFYCSREHQLAHWKEGHKKRCNIEKGDLESGEFLFDEFELVSEEFDDQQLTGGKEFEEDDGEEIADLESAQRQAESVEQTFENDEKELGNDKNEDVEELVQELSDEKFQRWVGYFKKEPEQVVRYQRGGKYLTPKGWKNVDFGKCKACYSGQLFSFVCQTE